MKAASPVSSRPAGRASVRGPSRITASVEARPRQAPGSGVGVRRGWGTARLEAVNVGFSAGRGDAGAPYVGDACAPFVGEAVGAFVGVGGGGATRGLIGGGAVSLAAAGG